MWSVGKGACCALKFKVMRLRRHLASWRGPFPAGLAGRRLVQVWKVIPTFSLLFFFFFLKKKEKKKNQKRAENKNLTSGQTRILLWKREVYGSFPT